MSPSTRSVKVTELWMPKCSGIHHSLNMNLLFWFQKCQFSLKLNFSTSHFAQYSMMVCYHVVQFMHLIWKLGNLDRIFWYSWNFIKWFWNGIATKHYAKKSHYNVFWYNTIILCITTLMMIKHSPDFELKTDIPYLTYMVFIVNVVDKMWV